MNMKMSHRTGRVKGKELKGFWCHKQYFTSLRTMCGIFSSIYKKGDKKGVYFVISILYNCLNAADKLEGMLKSG